MAKLDGVKKPKKGQESSEYRYEFKPVDHWTTEAWRIHKVTGVRERICGGKPAPDRDLDPDGYDLWLEENRAFDADRARRIQMRIDARAKADVLIAEERAKAKAEGRRCTVADVMRAAKLQTWLPVLAQAPRAPKSVPQTITGQQAPVKNAAQRAAEEQERRLGANREFERRKAADKADPLTPERLGEMADAAIAARDDDGLPAWEPEEATGT